MALHKIGPLHSTPSLIDHSLHDGKTIEIRLLTISTFRSLKEIFQIELGASLFGHLVMLQTCLCCRLFG